MIVRILAAVLAVALLFAAISLRPEPLPVRRYHYYYHQSTGGATTPLTEGQVSLLGWLPSAGAMALGVVALAVAVRKR